MVKHKNSPSKENSMSHEAHRELVLHDDDFNTFDFVINALMVYLVATFVPGFHVNGFWAALSFSLVLSIVSWFLKQLSK